MAPTQSSSSIMVMEVPNCVPGVASKGRSPPSGFQRLFTESCAKRMTAPMKFVRPGAPTYSTPSCSISAAPNCELVRNAGATGIESFCSCFQVPPLSRNT